MPLSKKITSLKNSSIKQVIDLRDRKTRDETNLMIVEGLKETLHAQKAGMRFKEVFLCPDFFKKNHPKQIMDVMSLSSVSIFETSQEVFEKISFGDRQEGILAVCEQPKKDFKDFKIDSSSIFIVVEGVEKPGNLGAILRTCDAAGVSGVILCDGGTDIYNPNVVRASLGTVFSVSVVQGSNQKAFQFLNDHQIKICATTPGAADIYTKVKLPSPLAIVLGNEQKGLSSFWLDHSHIKVKIPMKGIVDSLNVSTTAAIIIYEAIRQREN